MLLAIGGSTNAVIHLTAIAGRADVPLSLKRLNELSDTTPVLVNLKPVGNGYMEDFFAAGGMGALLRELRDLLHLDAMTVTGETLGERLAPKTKGRVLVDRTHHRRARQAAGAAGRTGRAVRQPRAAGRDPQAFGRRQQLFEHEGRAVVFSSLEDLAARIDDPKLDVEPDDILVLQNAGPHSAAAMPEAGYLPIPKKLAAAGVKDMVRVSDARMSGTAFGTIVLHVTPDAASGGPLGLVSNGDRIRLSVKSAASSSWSTRPSSSAAPRAPKPAETPARGYARLYAQEILGADEGCDFAFLKAR